MIIVLAYTGAIPSTTYVALHIRTFPIFAQRAVYNSIPHPVTPPPWIARMTAGPFTKIYIEWHTGGWNHGIVDERSIFPGQ